jgi:hypothetical protein
MKTKILYMFLLLNSVLFVGHKLACHTPQVVIIPEIMIEEEEKIEETMLPLEWEKNNPSRKRWSEYVFLQIENNFEILNSAKDIKHFCPNYKNLNKNQKINVWGQLIASMSFYESTFNPSARIASVSNSIDPVTSAPLISEGLLQVGYIDSLYHNCSFDWSKDSKLSDDDKRKTILNPYNNLSCGIKILTKQIRRYESIAIDKGAYWAVIKTNHPNSKLQQIIKMVGKYEICKA